MEQVYQNRLRWRHVAPCEECIGFIALLDRADVGRQVWLVYQGKTYGPILVIDCAQAAHRPDLVKRGWIADLSYELAVLLDTEWQPTTVTLWDRPPK